MKINALHLIAYGPFADRFLDMSGIDNGLHIIYGRNEAGKSSSLRALMAFLYGFEHRVQDDWLHGTKKLAVGATLALGNGRLLNLTRYKRRKNDLIDNDTGQTVDPHLLNQYLVNKSDFQNAYGISHEALRQGVETVLTAGGELGQTLFTATSGLNQLKAVLAGLDEKQKELFAPRAQKAAINNGVSRLSELRKQIRQVSAKPNDWKQKKKALEAFEGTKQTIDIRLTQLSTAISADTRARDALKYIAQLDDTQQELATLSAVPILSEEFQQRRVTAQAAIEASRKALDNLQNELSEITQRMQRLGFDETLIANRERIEALGTEIRSYRDWVSDSKNLRAKIHDANRQAQTALTHLQTDLKLEEIDALRLSKPAENGLRRLVQRHALLEQKKTTAEKELADVQPLIAKAGKTLSQLGRPLQTQELQSCLSRIFDHGNLDAMLSDMRTETQTLDQRLAKELAGLGLWSGDLEAFEVLALPPEASMRRFEKDLAQCRQTLADSEKECLRLDQVITDKQSQFRETTAQKRLPAPEDLRLLRQRRDLGWRSIRTVWLDGGEPDAQFLAAFPGRTTLADAFEQSVKDADDTADLLRTEAQSVATAQQLKKDISDLENRRQSQHQQHQHLSQQHQDLLAQWHDLWQPCGIDPYPPAEMLEWSRKAQTIKQTADDYRQKIGKQNQLQSLMTSLNAELSGTLARLGVQVPVKANHGALIDLAKSCVKQNEELHKQRQSLEVRLEEANKKKDDAQRQIDQTTRDMDQWLNQWQAALEPLKLPTTTKPEIALEFLDELKAIISTYDDAKKNQSRIDAMERNRADFQKRVHEAVAELAPQLSSDEPDRAAEALKSLLGEHIEQRQQYKHLEKDRRDRKKKLTQEQEKTAGNREILRQLCREACVDDPARLPDIERQSGRKAQVLSKEAAIKERLSELAAGQSIQAFIDHVRRQDPDTITAAVEKNELEKNELQNQRETLVADIAVTREALSQFDGRSHAAALAVQADGLAGRLQTQVEQYVKLHLASQMLTRAIERYRRENESPILEAAGRYFKVMTRDAFAGLKADFDDKGNPVIKAVRASDNAALTIEQMSDGSRDQLFLSLRLGGLQRHLEANGSMPFIADDVLVNFDDDRAAAALVAFSGLADKTQIIFFTHHQHLVELAKANVPENLLSTYIL